MTTILASEMFPVVFWVCPACNAENTTRFSQEKLSFHKSKCCRCAKLWELTTLREIWGSEYCPRLNIMAYEFSCDNCGHVNLIKSERLDTPGLKISQKLALFPLPTERECERCESKNALKMSRCQYVREEKNRPERLQSL